MNKVVLAFSGGLDTSFCAVYLAKERDLEVHAVSVNTGGFEQTELDQLKIWAKELGVRSFTVLDETGNYYHDCVRFLVFGNVLKNNTYPLSVSAERICQATAIAKYAKSIGAQFIAHGSTGAGNDQVRFDLIFNIIAPDIKILTPIRDLKLTREQEINYLHKNEITIDSEKAAYSVNKGLWGTSVGGKETLTSRYTLPEKAYPSQLSEKEPKEISLTFKKGELIGINEQVFSQSVQAIRLLQDLAGPYAIGRDIHIGDTIIGIKGRVGFESAAPIIIIKAHHTLEKHVLTKQQLLIKDQLSIWYGNWLHEGLFLDPVMRDIEAFFQNSQQKVNGRVFVTLYPYRFAITGIESENDLMSPLFGSYGEVNSTWSGEDVKGFSKIMSNALSIYFHINPDQPHE